jgi:hypothetical protein
VLLTWAAVLFLDGLDAQAIGFVAPALARFGLGRLAGTNTIAQPTCFDAKLQTAAKAGT